MCHMTNGDFVSACPGPGYFPIDIGVGFSPVRLGLAQPGPPRVAYLPGCVGDGPGSLGWDFHC